MDRRRGREWGGAITGRTGRRSRPIMGSHRHLQTINIAGSGAPKTTREAQRPLAPGRRAGESLPPPVGRRWIIGRRRGRDGRVKRRAAAGSPAPWCTRQNVTGRRDRRPDAGYGRPQARHRTQSALQAVGTFDVCSNTAVNSDLSCFLYRGRLKRLYLHCRANSVA